MRAWPVGIVGFMIVLGVGGYMVSEQRPGPLNLIVVSIDSLRYDHVSLYGYGRATTPNLDAWAEDKIVFENYFSTSFLTPISEMSVHTGRYPFANGVVSFASPLRADVPTLAEILKGRGWQTAAFGSSPEFQWFAALRSSFSRGFDVFPERLSGVASIEDQALRARGGNPIAEALGWLRTKRDTSKPFFLWIPVGSAHWPYGQNFAQVFSDKYYSGYFKGAPSNWQTYGLIYKNGRYEASTTTETVKGITSTNYDTGVPPQRVEELHPEDLAYVKDRYDDGLFATDMMLRDLFAYLKDTGLDEHTVVVIQSEHGEALGERGYVAHYDIADTEVHTPLIMSLPGFRPRREKSLMSGVDIAPTVLAALGIESGGTDGKNFIPYLRGATSTAPRNDIFIIRVPLWESVLSYAFGDLGKEFRVLDDAHRHADVAVRNKEWKLIHRRSRDAIAKYSWWGWVSGSPVRLPEYQLYDLQHDPDEKHDVYGNYESYPAVVALRSKLDAWEAEMSAAILGPTLPREIQPYF